MAVAALALGALFFGLTIGVRVAIQFRRTGFSGINRSYGHPGSIEWWAAMLFFVGLAAAPLGPVLVLTGTLEPIPSLDRVPLAIAGLLLALVSVVLVFCAQLAMGDSWRIGVEETERTDLVTNGVFGIVRNPIFGALIPLMLGFTLMVPTVLAIANLLVLTLAIELQVRLVEEPYLLRTHGEDYRAYASRVGRFAPGLGLLAPRSRG